MVVPSRYTNQRVVYEWVNILDKCMNGSVFFKARYMNGIGFEILACAPVPKLPPSYPPPTPPPSETRDGQSAFEHAQNEQIQIILCLRKVSSRLYSIHSNELFSVTVKAPGFALGFLFLSPPFSPI